MSSAIEKMDEELFHDLYDLYVKDGIPLGPPQLQQDFLVKSGMSSNIASIFVLQYNQLRKFQSNFGDPSLAVAIDKLNCNSRNKELRRLGDRLSAKIDGDLEDISITFPDKDIGLFTIAWHRSQRLGAPDEYNLPTCTKALSTAFTLELLPDTQHKPGEQLSFVAILLGTIERKNVPQPWKLVRLLDKRQYWVIFDYGWAEPTSDLPYVQPEERKRRFGNSGDAIAVGRLRGLFTKRVTLEPVNTTGYKLFDACRDNGDIRTV